MIIGEGVRVNVVKDDTVMPLKLGERPTVRRWGCGSGNNYRMGHCSHEFPELGG